jgi:4'-phosphopantetheinyl transferase EntD
VFDAILPAGTSVVSVHTDLPEELAFPEEMAHVANAAEVRRREFATARICAHRALAALGVARRPLLPGPAGVPQWPRGITGSITHCRGYRACVVGPSSAFRSLGIDAEPNLPLPPGIAEDIALPEERAWIVRSLRAQAEISWDRLLFCMKEATYKAWFPLTSTWLEFKDVGVEVCRSARTFEARLPKPLPGSGSSSTVRGRWVARDGLLGAAVAVPAGAADRWR